QLHAKRDRAKLEEVFQLCGETLDRVRHWLGHLLQGRDDAGRRPAYRARRSIANHEKHGRPVDIQPPWTKSERRNCSSRDRLLSQRCSGLDRLSFVSITLATNPRRRL